MKLLLDANGNAVLRDGKPVYVMDDGSEVVFDAHGATVSIAKLRSEAKTNRERAEKAEQTLETFKDLDPEVARKALATVKNFDDKKLVDAGKVEEVKNEVNKAWQEKFDKEKTRADTAEQVVQNEKIGGSFMRSKYVSDKMVIPSDVVQSFFGKHFKLEEGRVVAYDGNNQRIHSKANPGDIADFDEALEILVTNYPRKDAILKANNAAGAGTSSGNVNNSTIASKQVTRKAFDAMNPLAKSEFIGKGGAVVDA